LRIGRDFRIRCRVPRRAKGLRHAAKGIRRLGSHVETIEGLDFAFRSHTLAALVYAQSSRSTVNFQLHEMSGPRDMTRAAPLATMGSP
jgi:NADH:ubiquinone oxidoreductase subunit D